MLQRLLVAEGPAGANQHWWMGRRSALLKAARRWALPQAPCADLSIQLAPSCPPTFVHARVAAAADEPAQLQAVDEAHPAGHSRVPSGGCGGCATVCVYVWWWWWWVGGGGGAADS